MSLRFFERNGRWATRTNPTPVGPIDGNTRDYLDRMAVDETDLWMPTSTNDVMPLASLSTCHINLNRNCDLLGQHAFMTYHEAWKTPAPLHCQPRQRLITIPQPVYNDRLGVFVQNN